MGIPVQGSIAELEAFKKAHPEITTVEVLICDVNGIFRGKRIPVEELDTLFTKGSKMPGTVSMMNVQGDVSDEGFIGSMDGDPDKALFPVANTLVPIPWVDSNTAQIVTGLLNLDGTDCFWDPRTLLQETVNRLNDAGFKPVVATELEFYLVEQGDDGLPRPVRPKVPATNGIMPLGMQYGLLEDLWDLDAFLDDVNTAAKIQGIPATTAHSEFSQGQYEINLNHVDCPVTAADHGALLKRLIKGVARKHGFTACFMAKPFQEWAGNGLHMHISLYNNEGKNAFYNHNTDQVPAINDTMRHAIGGMAKISKESMLFTAPNANSFRRLVPGIFAPLTPNWGYNHRSVSLRIPVCGEKDMRVEHRFSGADASPHLVMASALAGMHYGIENQVDPGQMVAESEKIEEVITLPRTWEQAINKFKEGEILKEYLGSEFCKLYGVAKTVEWEMYNSMVTPLDYQWYMRVV